MTKQTTIVLIGSLRVKISTMTFCYLLMCLKYTVWVVNSADPDQTNRSVAFDFSLHCLRRPTCMYIVSYKCIIEMALHSK